MPFYRARVRWGRSAEKWTAVLEKLHDTEETRCAAACLVLWDWSDRSPGDWHAFRERWCSADMDPARKDDLIFALRRLGYLNAERRVYYEDEEPEPDLAAIRADVLGR